MAIMGMSPSTEKPPFQAIWSLIPLVVLAYALADLSILSLRDRMLPNQAPPNRPASFTDSTSQRGSYGVVISRNIFNSEGLIPEPISSPGGKGQPTKEADPVPSQLPLNLIGTIVLSNPDRSIAHIEIKGRNINLSVTPKKDIENIATLVRVERNKAIIRNANNGRLEYIEIKSSNKISFSTSGPQTGVGTEEVVRQLAPNKFEINRTDLNRYLTDVSSLLMQASSVPRKKPNGEIECYIINSIQPNSVFTQLQVMNGDCIKNVNGEPINSPTKALELFQALKNSSSIKLTVERDGRDVEKDYTIK